MNTFEWKGMRSNALAEAIEMATRIHTMIADGDQIDVVGNNIAPQPLRGRLGFYTG